MFFIKGATKSVSMADEQQFMETSENGDEMNGAEAPNDSGENQNGAGGGQIEASKSEEDAG